MKLNETQLKEIEENGYVILPDCFSNEEVNNLRTAMTTVFKEKTEANIIEKSSGVVRTAMGLHLRSKIFDDLTRHPKFFEPACQIRGHNLYIQQTKINVKAAFTGEVWQWHYDFATHSGEDGVPKPLALNLHVFLDDITELMVHFSSFPNLINMVLHHQNWIQSLRIIPYGLLISRLSKLL